MTPRTASKKKQVKTASNPWSTPAMQQFKTMKDAHPECILFFRMGDFYEMFDEDARIVSKAIGLSLTQRGNGIDMAGVPFHAAEGYISKMVKEGFRVAVCEQLEHPSEAKGVVKRGVTRIVTPGTLIDETLLDESTTNLLAAACCNETTAFIATTELSTGTFECYQCKKDRLTDLFERVGLSELIVSEEDEELHSVAAQMKVSITKRPEWMFAQDEGIEKLCKQFNVSTVEGFGFQNKDLLCGAAGALLHYIQNTQASDELLIHLQPPSIQNQQSVVAMDATTIRSLEIEQTIRGHVVEGSLLWVMQQCNTPMGKRLLRKWLCEPLTSIEAIEARQSIVTAFIEQSELFHDVKGFLKSIQDIARICGRNSMGRVTPRDIVALGHSLHSCEDLMHTLDVPACDAIRTSIKLLQPDLTSLALSILTQCSEQPPAHMRDGGLFKDGIDGVLDQARGLQRDAGTWLATYQAELMVTSGINTLKVGYNKVFGYYIEVTHAQTSRVPDTFSRKQTLKNAERYITPALKEFEQKVLSAEADALKREQELFGLLCETVASNIASISQYANIIASIDALLSFASVAKQYGYVKPILVSDPVIQIQNGKHPVLAKMLEHDFVQNDCSLYDQTTALITGPNMAGKSTYIRQIALITLLAHTGSYVPADAATIGIVDRIFTRVGASDELHSGQSTFMVEMVETANILNNATKHSLVILDEIGRGTSTLDGLSLAWAIAERLADCGCRTLFATHYHELTTLAEQRTNVMNLHVKIREWKDDIVFLYRIEEGRSDRSYGIHVAKIAGVPPTVVKRANELLESLTVHTQQASEASARHMPPPQMNLFTSSLPNPLLEELKSIDLDSMSPMDAFEYLRRLSRRASDEGEH